MDTWKNCYFHQWFSSYFCSKEKYATIEWAIWMNSELQNESHWPSLINCRCWNLTSWLSQTVWYCATIFDRRAVQFFNFDTSERTNEWCRLMDLLAFGWLPTKINFVKKHKSWRDAPVISVKGKSNLRLQYVVVAICDCYKNYLNLR